MKHSLFLWFTRCKALGLLLTRPRGVSQVCCPSAINSDTGRWVSVAATPVPFNWLRATRGWGWGDPNHGPSSRSAEHHSQLRGWGDRWSPQGEYQNESPPATLEAFSLSHQLFLLTQCLLGFPFLLKASLHQNEAMGKIIWNILSPTAGFSSSSSHVWWRKTANLPRNGAKNVQAQQGWDV